MTTKEMSDQFDVLYNNITSNQAPGLNEYEKSLFLTKAQDEIIKNHFVKEGNQHQKGFDDSHKRQIDFSMLMKTDECTEISSSANVTQFDPRSLLYSIPDDIFFIVNEQFVISHPGTGALIAMRQVVPISLDEYTRLMSKPYKEPLRYQAWRLLTSVSSSVGVAELVIRSSDKTLINSSSGSTIPTVPNDTYYKIRYVKRPQPIILDNFTSTMGEGISIGGLSVITECELDPILHEEILQRAVELAKVAWTGDVSATIQTGNRSE